MTFIKFTKQGNLLLLTGLLLFSFSCRKTIGALEGKTCWKCHVKGVYPSGEHYDYNKTKCTDDDRAPQFQDDNGNSLNATCEKL